MQQAAKQVVQLPRGWVKLIRIQVFSLGAENVNLTQQVRIPLPKSSVSTGC